MPEQITPRSKLWLFRICLMATIPFQALGSATHTISLYFVQRNVEWNASNFESAKREVNCVGEKSSFKAEKICSLRVVSSWAISGISFVRPATLFLPLGKVISMNSFLVPLGQTSSDDQIIRSSQVWKANITKSVMNFRVDVLSDFGREMGSPRVWVSAKRLELYDLVEKWKLIL